MKIPKIKIPTLNIPDVPELPLAKIISPGDMMERLRDLCVRPIEHEWWYMGDVTAMARGGDYKCRRCNQWWTRGQETEVVKCDVYRVMEF